MAPRADVVIVGGGIIGLACARALAHRDASVVLFDRDVEARGATWAAGGMLAPLGEAPDPGPFLSFGLAALAAWPGFAEAIEAESGHSVGFRRCGKLLVADGGANTARLRARYAWQHDDGHDVRWLEGTAVRRVEPALGERWSAGLHLPDHAVVDPRRAARALRVAARRAGVELRSGEPIDRILTLEGRVGGVRTAGGATVASGAVVVAAGAWSGGLAGLPRPLPVRPVRGQMLAVDLDTPLVDGLLAGPGAYLIPRTDVDGSPLMVVGASMEDAGFEVATDADTIDALRTAAETLVPGLAGRPERSRWAGLRPGTPDDLPLLGPDPEVAGLVYATGHHRNGILLAPSTAQAVADWVEGRMPPETWFDAFDPVRFGG